MAITTGNYTQTTNSGEVLTCTVVEIILGQSNNGYATVHYRLGDSKFVMTEKEHIFEQKWVIA